MKGFKFIQLIFSLLILFPCQGIGQTDSQVPPVTLNMRNVPLEDIFRELEKQTGMFFSYESSLLKDLPKVSFVAEEESFYYSIKRLFDKLPLTYRITNQYVIIKHKPVQYTISGFIRDSITFESLIQATLVEKNTGKGVVSNNYGFYSITLPAGEIILSSSYVGYGEKEIRFYLDRDTLFEINLIPMSALQDVVVHASQTHSSVLNSRMGNLQLQSTVFHKNPAIFSEPDPLRTLHLTPGVSFGTEGFSGLYVRGGGGDENLFLVDGIPIYGVSHVGGMFSTFNPDVIKYTDFYKGGFPARYGGRLSSVMDVRLKEGDMKEYHGSLSIGLISAKAHFEGPIVKDRTSFNLGFRRTWLDAITTPVLAIANRRNESEMFAGYSFYDLNAKVTHVFNSRSRIYANFYMGQDRLRFKETYTYSSDPRGDDMKWRWGNLISALNWTYIFNNKLFGNLNVAYTRYKSKMSQWERFDSYNTLYLGGYGSIGFGESESTQMTDQRRNSGIEDIAFKYDFDYTPRPDHTIRFGADYIFHIYRPAHYKTLSSSYFGEEMSYKEESYIEETIYGQESAVYFEDDWLLSERWRMNMGARLGFYHVKGHSYFAFQPRLSVRYLLKENLSLKASYVKMNQYVHQLSNTYLDLPSAIWVPVTAKVKPMQSHLFSAGVYYEPDKTWDLSMELYYKKMNHIVEYKDFASMFPNYVNWDDKVSLGSGRSYGVEWMAHKTHGPTTGWISYTLAWSDRIFKDGHVNSGVRFPDRYDNRHKINATLNHTLNKKWDMSLAWMFASGNKASVITTSYLSPQLNGKYGDNDYLFESVYSRNVIKTRSYHRLDVGFNYYRPKKKGRMGIWNISFYNLYSRMNTFMVKSATVSTGGKVIVKEKGLIPIIPSVSYTYKF